MHRFLIVRLDEIGDYILTIPLFRELKQRFPGAVIDVVVNPAVAELAAACPYISHVYTALPPRRKLYRNLRLFAFLTAQRWRCGKYDAVILPRMAPDRSCSRLLAWAAGGKKIYGFRSALHGPDVFIPHILAEPQAIHSVSANLSFLNLMGIACKDNHLRTADILRNGPPPERIAALKKLIGWEETKTYALCGFITRDCRKNWPAANFRSLLRALHEKHGVTALLAGSNNDALPAEEICSALPAGAAVPLCGETRLSEIPALAALCRFYVGADTSIAHFAAAAGLPCAVLTPHFRNYSGWLSAAVRFHPWQVPCKIIYPEKMRPPCGDYCTAAESHCIEEITPEAVLKAVEELLPAIHR